MNGVARTAVGAAWLRARESERPDRLFDDPYAGAFVAAAGAGQGSGAAGVFGDHLAFRTRFFDDYLRESGCDQVVLPAAGLDSRAYRLAWPAGVRLFELDQPELLAFKDGVLRELGATARCERVPVPVDLREDWPGRLRAAGFDPARPTAWLVEGLLIYLSAAEAGRLLGEIGALSAAGSRLAFEHDRAAAAALIERARTMPALRRVATLWKGGLGEDAVAWLTTRGWRADVVELSALAARYGRPAQGGGFLTAVRGDADHPDSPE
ncbi:SAM-dependent methyltransferase [Nonomuraea spiralis]|uniref:S-adenosyl-L-methionine-dependent methyltransferase n=1 Tax=Nonomuraea spiralis TaxID=46182 RepID=A0ABV5IW19_9ACTN|nr:MULTISPECIES: SAM-dependent methyltransferase [Nonomuraea]RSN05082.1 SAM-dependent methyltransferase [Nonomuraea sp. WAC 01424]